MAFSLGNSFAAPTITVWYGLNQSFGQIGNPQTAVNILGNVTDANGIQSLNYRLNGGSPITLSRGPDTRRLLKAGDFNIDIYTSALNNGSNSVLITATNTLSQVSIQTVTVNYTAGQTWPTTYSIDWAIAGTIQSVAQVTDGHWTLASGTVRPTYLGYDRLVAIGDKTWTDYEATVPITISNIDSSGFNPPSNGAGVGLIFRWSGHTDNPLSGYQPKTGYLPLGAMGWYSWDGSGSRFSLVGNNLINLAPDNTSLTLSFGVTYYFKMRVVTLPGGGSEYKLRVWQANQTEPTTWLLQGVQSLANDPPTGSMLLAAHHVNATFGNVTITPTHVRVNIKALLQGPYSTPGDSMRTGLRGILPLTQPYNIGPWNYAGTESVASIPDSVVDWVLLELRTDTTAASKVGTRAAFIKRTGNIVATDGVSSVTFNGVTPGNYYVVVRHRNHLAVMTSSPISLDATSSTLYSFTSGQSQAYGASPMGQIGSTFVLHAGDANSSTNISGPDATVVFANVNSAAYLAGDTNMSGIVTSADASMVFDNLNKTSRVPAP